MADVVLQADHVTKDYVSNSVTTRALDDVSIEIERGEFSAIAGPSGSGKTTLLNVLGTIDGPSSGVVRVDGADVTAMRESERSDLRLHRLGFIFQSYNLIPVLTATENVEFVLMLQGIGARERRAKAEQTLTDLGLGELLRKRPTQMSGGQQQRVAVARAIASEPSIVLADEPTANLDSRTAENLLELMLRMNEERGVTFLFSTHDKRVMDRARRVVQLVDGRIESDEQRT